MSFPGAAWREKTCTLSYRRWRTSLSRSDFRKLKIRRKGKQSREAGLLGPVRSRKSPMGGVRVSGWTPVHTRKQLAIGVNEVTRALERNELLLVLVCKSVKPAIITSHLIQLSLSRTVPACQVPQLSERIAPVIGLKCVLALGFRKNTMDFADEVEAIIPRVPSLNVPWLPDGTQGLTDSLETESLESQDKEVLDTSFDDLTRLKRKLAEGGQAPAATLQPLKIKRLVPNPSKIRKPPKSKNPSK